MVICTPYSSELRLFWDSFILNAKNSHFMFYRSYMDYHNDKFIDASLMFYYKNKLIALFVANIDDQVIYSHQGLSFGGFLMHKNITIEHMIECFDIMHNYYKELGVKKVIYKAIPYIYHNYAAEEDLYCLFKNKYQIYRRDINSVIYLHAALNYTESRKSSLRKFKNSGLIIEKSCEVDKFIQLLNEVLSKHNAESTHNARDLYLLISHFPDNIELYIVKYNNEIIAGGLFFITENVIHSQYLASNEYGRSCGALDGVIDTVIKKYSLNSNKKYFSFGISTENNGNYLNRALIFQKEGFGARGVVHDFYELWL